VRIPGIGRISGPAGAFSRAGTITIRGQRAAFAVRIELRPAGLGIGVWFHDTALRKPLSLTFDVGARPNPQAVPVIARLLCQEAGIRRPARDPVTWTRHGLHHQGQRSGGRRRACY